MRKLLNTLYVTSEDAYLSRDGENIVVKVEGEERFRIPVHNVESVVCFGYQGASPSLMALCAERHIGLCFISPQGRFLARVQGPVSGNVLLRRTQYRWADSSEQSLRVSRLMIAAKLANSRAVLQRAARDYPDSPGAALLEQAAIKLKAKQKQALEAASAETLRGLEGDSAQAYFDCFPHLLTAQQEHFAMQGRSRRPPLDPVNALLSLSYALLAHECRSALESVGLDPCVGFLHTDRPGRPSLALDLMEEMRAYLADRFVLTLINRRQVGISDFEVMDTGAVMLKDKPRKELLAAWQKRKQEEITHPYLQEKISLGLLPYTQALLLARCLRGDLEQYPVFLVK